MATRSATVRQARSSSSQFMWPRVSVTPAPMAERLGDVEPPFSSMQKATGLASSGSAANSSIFNPAGTRKVRMAFSAWSDAAATTGL